MIEPLRSRYNSDFSSEKYERLQELLARGAGEAPEFRLSESPVFLSKEMKTKLLEVSESLIEQISSLKAEDLEKAIPPSLKVPGDTEKPHFIAIDYGICESDSGEIEPQLIELQGFPSLFAYQHFYTQTFISSYPWLRELSSISEEKYPMRLFKEVVLGDHSKENVVLLELYPEKQKTRIDFLLTEDYLGIKTVCLTKVEKIGNELFYELNGEKTKIKRIYNRVIFDELEGHSDVNFPFSFQEDLDVEWVTHPNWFFKISKFLLPSLSHKYVPKSYFANEFPLEEDLGNYVLKPLFSFAGAGVNLAPTSSDLESLENKADYILQRKVSYAPLFRDLEGEKAKAEIRLLYLWKEENDRPILVESIVRMTKSAMANVDFNKDSRKWIGSSLAFFEKP